MTDQHHPLTDDICLAIDDNPSVAYSCFDWKKSMRTAADWQLEQVIKWIEYNLGSHYIRPEGCPHRPAIGYVLLTEDVIENLKEAMRPQEDNS